MTSSSTLRPPAIVIAASHSQSIATSIVSATPLQCGPTRETVFSSIQVRSNAREGDVQNLRMTKENDNG